MARARQRRVNFQPVGWRGTGVPPVPHGQDLSARREADAHATQLFVAAARQRNHRRIWQVRVAVCWYEVPPVERRWPHGLSGPFPPDWHPVCVVLVAAFVWADEVFVELKPFTAWCPNGRPVTLALVESERSCGL